MYAFGLKILLFRRRRTKKSQLFSIDDTRYWGFDTWYCSILLKGSRYSVRFFFKAGPQGRVKVPKRMIFRKNPKRPLTPPNHFRKIMLQIFHESTSPSLPVSSTSHQQCDWEHLSQKLHPSSPLFGPKTSPGGRKMGQTFFPQVCHKVDETSGQDIPNHPPKNKQIFFSSRSYKSLKVGFVCSWTSQL